MESQHRVKASPRADLVFLPAGDGALTRRPSASHLAKP